MTATATMPRRAGRRPGAPLGYLFTPTPDALEDDPRAADAAVRAWGYVHRVSKGTNALVMSWAELATLCGRDRQWVKTWVHKLHNLGWATVTQTPGGANMIVLHTSPDSHIAYRELAGGEEKFFTHTDDATKAARAERKASGTSASPAIPSLPSPRIETHPGVDEKSSTPSPAETGCSTTRAYARTREDRAHETTQCNAGGGESVEQVMEPVKLARGIRPASRPKQRVERPVPPRPQIAPGLQALHQELSRAKLTVRWHDLSPIEAGMIEELLEALGAEQMARIAWKTTNAAVAAGKQPAHHIRAYVNTWAQHAPVYGFEQQDQAPVIAAKCSVHPAMSNPCELCVADRRLTSRADHLQAPDLDEPSTEDTTAGAEFVAELRRKRAEAAAEGRSLVRKAGWQTARGVTATPATETPYDPAPLIFNQPTDAERLVDLDPTWTA